MRGERGQESCDDNCPTIYNHDQKDTDGDGMGNACEFVEIAVDDYVWWGSKRVNKDFTETETVPYLGGLVDVAVDDEHVGYSKMKYPMENSQAIVILLKYPNLI